MFKESILVDSVAFIFKRKMENPYNKIMVAFITADDLLFTFHLHSRKNFISMSREVTFMVTKLQCDFTTASL